MRVDALLPAFAAVFDFERFNAMQAAVIPTLLETPGNVVVAAPTASGKTAIAEAAICQQLDGGGTALFIAPLRALTNEKEAEWDRLRRWAMRCTSSPASGTSTPRAPRRRTCS